MKYLNPVNLILTIIVIGLGYYLYSIIEIPIRFTRTEKARTAVVIQKLKDIRAAQLAYKDLKGSFADNFSTLINTINRDSFHIIKVIGNPDDTNQVVVRDTVILALRDSLFPANYPVDSLRFIPFSKQKEFGIRARQIIKGNVQVQVFQIDAPYAEIFHDIDVSLYDDTKIISVGSMDEVSYAGNWE